MRARALVSLATFGVLFVLLCAATQVKGMTIESALIGASLQSWDNFQPSGWVTSTLVTCTIEVYYEEGFIDEAEYQYRTGNDWTGWITDDLQIVVLDTTSRRLIVSNLAFPHSATEDQNQIQFRIKSSLDEWLESNAYSVRVDSIAPDSTVVVASCYSSTMEIRGTASDSGSGVYVVEIALQRASDSWYYNGASWMPTMSWIAASGTTNWSLPFTPTVETVYTVTSKAIDSAGNVQSALGSGVFRYDATPPQSVVTTTGCFSTWPGAIQGSASDAFSGVASVQVRVQRASDRFYYNGTSWDPSESWVAASGTTVWSLPFMPSVETVYTVTSKAVDNCGNWQNVFITSTFSYDITPPQTVVTTTGCFNSWPGAIQGSASDLVSGVAYVQVRLQRALDGLYYDGSSWTPIATWITATETTSWSLPFTPVTETTYLVAVRAADHCGNLQSMPGTGAFTYDITPPQSEVSTTGYFNIWPGTIEGTASDLTSGVASVQITLQRAVDGLYYNGAFWGPVATWITTSGTAAWSLAFTPTIETVYTVTSRAIDHCGNAQSVPSTGVFTYDVTPPQSTVVTTGYFNTWAGIIEGMASDALSGIAYVQITVQRAVDGLYYNGITWGPTASWITASGTTAWSLPFVPLMETVYTVTSRAVDNSGNVQLELGIGIFTYDITPPYSLVATAGCLSSWPGSIEGTANDALSGVASVQIKLQRASDGFYYSGSSWEPIARWIEASGTITWSLPFTPTVETVYEVTSRAIDHCGNIQIEPDTAMFTYDTTPPESVVTTVGYFNTWMGAIEGTASDAVSGVTHVLVKLQRSQDLFYYDGLSWVPAERWITATGTTTWTVPFTPTVEAVYTVTCRAADSCGNVQDIPGKGMFVYDITPPSSPFNLAVEPSIWTPVNSFTVTWECLDDLSGIGAVHYKWNAAPVNNEDESPGSPVPMLGEGIRRIQELAVPTQGAHQLFIWLEDRAGNVNYQTRNATTVGAFKWDAEPPATTLVNLDARQGCEGWYTSAVQVNLSAVDVNPDPGTINATSGISATFWRKDGGSWQQVVGSNFQVTEQGVHTVEYYSVDIAGNNETPRELTPTLKIDTVPPTTYQPMYTGTLGQGGWYISPVSVSLNAMDATSGISVTYYQVDTDTLRTGNAFSVSADGAHTIRYYSVDVACNQETEQTATLKIDRTHPTTSYQLEGVQGDNGWFLAAPVTVTLLASDAITGVQESSGVDKIYYRVDSGPWQIRGPTASFTITIPAGQSEYMRTVTYYATDLAGNIEPTHTLTVGVDSQAPLALPYAPYPVPSGWTNVNCFDIHWFANPSDFSGIGGAYYSFHVPVSPTDGILVLGDNITSIPCVQVPTQLGDGLHNVYVWLRDKAGNSDHRTRHAVTLALDQTPPQLSMIVEGRLCDTSGWYNSPISVTFVATDALSGMATGVISYQVNGGGWVTGTSYYESHDGRYVIESRARDVAGNCSDIIITTVKVDRTAPEAPTPIWVEPSDWSRENSFVIRWVNPWDLSGIAGVYYKQESPPTSSSDGTFVDGFQSSLTVSATEEGLIQVYVWLVDKACNKDHQKRSMVTLKHDRTPPTTTFTAEGSSGEDGWYNSDVQITLHCADDHSGCQQGGTYYRIGDEAWQNGNSFVINAEGVITFSYYSVDIAGNAESARTGAVKIDRIPPSSYVYADSYSASPSFTVRWNGSDASSGLAAFDIQYKEGTTGAWQDWAISLVSSQRSKLFTGVRGKTYYFRSRARDKAGNVEAYPATADTYVSVDPLLNGDFERDIASEWEILWKHGGGQDSCWPTRVYTQSYSGGNSYAVVLGCSDRRDAPFGESMICQTINVPTAQNMPAPLLLFRYRIFTYDIVLGPTTGKFYDSFNVGAWHLGQLAPTYVFTDGSKIPPLPPYPLWDLGWREGAVDLKPYAGQTLKVCLANVTREDERLNTWTYVDDVRVVNLEHKLCLPIIQRVAPAAGLAAKAASSALPQTQEERELPPIQR